MNTKPAFFITGTDTEIGKTWSTAALLRAFQQQGKSALAMKPVSAGCQWLDGRWQNDDALLLQRHSSLQLPYDWVNPYAFERAISPHLAANGVDIDLSVIRAAFASLEQQADVVLVEGAGGWLSPLSDHLNNQGLATALDLPVILVVGMRLGCLNHACLSYQAIRASGRVCAGWIANSIDPAMQALEGNLDYLQNRIDAPFLGLLPFVAHADFERLAAVVQPQLSRLEGC
ncbi:MAG: dethiobiotin synthase [Methylomonas sp.]|nr:dethiobiotin synthase [Methylomonas sp.]PPD20812.1 MAG: dethiobiotin synthase [Methylomonas sp.]PPD27264.1 MAG: dethiobiotin synthase [Methylomonas sp.]PPD38268.1 MAG: dethiobiotin synthase [Methylomonas sp.]PPD39236.1 MAG: dethiobiotin synthase [Methylomonas sp.]